MILGLNFRCAGKGYSKKLNDYKGQIIFVIKCKMRLIVWNNVSNKFNKYWKQNRVNDFLCDRTRVFRLSALHNPCKFIRQKPLEIIGIHCTHGFNRTGFLLISYLVEVSDLKERSEI